LLNTNNSWSG